jgi:hypothetical protein
MKLEEAFILVEEENSMIRDIESALRAIVKKKMPGIIENVMVDVFTAAVILIMNFTMSPTKRRLFMALPISKIIKYSLRNLPKLIHDLPKFMALAKKAKDLKK